MTLPSPRTRPAKRPTAADGEEEVLAAAVVVAEVVVVAVDVVGARDPAHVEAVRFRAVRTKLKTRNANNCWNIKERTWHFREKVM